MVRLGKVDFWDLVVGGWNVFSLLVSVSRLEFSFLYIASNFSSASKIWNLFGMCYIRSGCETLRYPGPLVMKIHFFFTFVSVTMIKHNVLLFSFYLTTHT